uniref:DUF4283 domain-containing protein n=1 Tax=Chenopodium quinoa TaxID=63459 RepID=A0A803MD70_CHEQI
MAEELVKDWEKLKLTEEENTVLRDNNGDGEDENAQTRLQLYLVGKMLTKKPYNIEAMKRVLKKLWRLSGNVAIRKIVTNLFIFQFFNEDDKCRVLDGRPWAFDQQIVLLDVPFRKRNATFAREIGDAMGGFLEFDDSDPLRLGHTDKDCLEQGKEGEEDAFVFQYGPFLVASPHQKSRTMLAERENEKKWIESIQSESYARR